MLLCCVYVYIYHAFVDFARSLPPFPAVAIDSATAFYCKIVQILKHDPVSLTLFVVRQVRWCLDCSIYLADTYNSSVENVIYSACAYNNHRVSRWKKKCLLAVVMWYLHLQLRFTRTWERDRLEVISSVLRNKKHAASFSRTEIIPSFHECLKRYQSHNLRFRIIWKGWLPCSPTKFISIWKYTIEQYSISVYCTKAYVPRNHLLHHLLPRNHPHWIA